MRRDRHVLELSPMRLMLSWHFAVHSFRRVVPLLTLSVVEFVFYLEWMENWILELWKHVLYVHHRMCYKIEFTQIIINSGEVELWHRLQSACIFLFYWEKKLKISAQLSERNIFELNNELITLIFTLCCGGLRLCGGEEKNCILWKFHKLSRRRLVENAVQPGARLNWIVNQRSKAHFFFEWIRNVCKTAANSSESFAISRSRAVVLKASKWNLN